MLVADRSCGQCTVCCRVLEIEALGKPAGVLCRHNTGNSCGIYEERPEACVQWHCLWRRISALPDALRPDRSGVVFSLEREGPARDASMGACIVGRAVEGEQAFKEWEAVEAFAMFAREGSLPVWRVSEGTATLMHAGNEGVPQRPCGGTGVPAEELTSDSEGPPSRATDPRLACSTRRLEA